MTDDIVTAERETPVRVLLERHLIDLQLQNAPEQYLISRVLARLMELEIVNEKPPATAKNYDRIEADFCHVVIDVLATWIVEGRQWRASITMDEVLDRAQEQAEKKLVNRGV